MKKILFIFVLLFLFNYNVLASSKFYLGEKVPNMKTTEYNSYDSHTGIPFVLRREDGAFTYCLDPFLKFNDKDYLDEYTYNNSKFNISDDVLKKMNLIAYYGYGYENHTDLKWYGVTQFLIWKQLNLNDIYFVDVDTLNRVNTYDKEVKEIVSLVDNYYTLPSISKKLTYTINSEYEEIDLNGVINNYDIVDSNIEAKIVDNKLKINTNSDGVYYIKLKRHIPIDNDYIIYHTNGYQPLLLPGKVEDVIYEIEVEVISGSVTINKKDSEDKSRLEASLEGATYGLYNEDEIITTLVTDINGFAYIDSLPIGSYYIKELEPSLGYKIDTNTYSFNLTYNNPNVTIESEEEVIKGELVINKYYGRDNYILEDGAEFDIYDSKNNIVTSLITNNGIAKTILDYGKYYMIQTKGISNYKFIDKFNFNIFENREYKYNLYDEPLIVEVPDTFKIDYMLFVPYILIISGIILVIVSKKTTLG